MQFNYKPEEISVSKGSSRKVVIWRPIIPVILLKNTKMVGYETLLDSGADFNVFHGGIAQILGIKLISGKKRRISGISGQSIKGYVHKVEMKIQGSSPFKTSVVFSNQIPEKSIGVLGNTGFFDKFTVQFDYRNKSIEIS